MSWYAGHVILFFKFKDGHQDAFPTWENIYLIQANSDEEAWAKAESLGRLEEGDDSVRCDGRPALITYAGVRKVVSCFSGETVRDGDEITHTVMKISTRKDIQCLVKGEEVSLILEAVSYPEGH